MREILHQLRQELAGPAAKGAGAAGASGAAWGVAQFDVAKSRRELRRVAKALGLPTGERSPIRAAASGKSASGSQRAQSTSTASFAKAAKAANQVNGEARRFRYTVVLPALEATGSLLADSSTHVEAIVRRAYPRNAQVTVSPATNFPA